MNTVIERFRNGESAFRAINGCTLGVDRHNCTTSLFRFVGQELQEYSPGSIADALGEAMVSYHAPDVQIFIGNKIVFVGYFMSKFVQEINSLIANMSMCLDYQKPGLAAALRAFNFRDEPSLPISEDIFTLSEIAGIFDGSAIREDSKGFQTDINTHCCLYRLLRGSVSNIATKAGVPFISFPLDVESFNLTEDITMHLDLDAADLREIQFRIFDFKSKLGISETIITVVVLEPGIARLLIRLHTPKECFESLIGTMQYILKHLRINAGELRADLFQIGKLRTLSDKREGFALHFISITSLLKSGIVEITAQFKSIREPKLLICCRIETVSESLMQLNSLLCLYILTNSLIRYIACCRSKIAIRPKRWNFKQFRELFSEIKRTSSLKSLYQQMQGQLRIARNEQMQMIRHYLQGQYFHLFLSGYFLNDLSESCFNSTNKHLSSAFRTPNKMIVYQKYLISQMLVFHVYSISLIYNIVK